MALEAWNPDLPPPPHFISFFFFFSVWIFVLSSLSRPCVCSSLCICVLTECKETLTPSQHRDKYTVYILLFSVTHILKEILTLSTHVSLDQLVLSSFCRCSHSQKALKLNAERGMRQKGEGKEREILRRFYPEENLQCWESERFLMRGHAAVQLIIIFKRLHGFKARTNVKISFSYVNTVAATKNICRGASNTDLNRF